MTDKLKRRWLRYSLRTLLVFVTIACVGFGWLGMKLRAKQKEREAVEAIRFIRGFARYDYQFDREGFVDMQRKPSIPSWLRHWLGDDFFGVVWWVRYPPSATNGDLEFVECLGDLRILELGNTQMSDAGLSPLAEMSQLRSLSLAGNRRITDAMLQHVRGLKSLSSLDLHRTKITDAGCQELQKALPNLKISR